MKRHHQDTFLAVWHYKSVWGICGACRGPPNKIHMQDCITNVWKMYLGIYILVHWNEKFNIQLHASGLVPSGFFIFWNLSQLSKAQQDVAHHTFCFSHGIWKSNDTNLQQQQQIYVAHELICERACYRLLKFLKNGALPLQNNTVWEH